MHCGVETLLGICRIPYDSTRCCSVLLKATWNLLFIVCSSSFFTTVVDSLLSGPGPLEPRLNACLTHLMLPAGARSVRAQGSFACPANILPSFIQLRDPGNHDTVSSWMAQFNCQWLHGLESQSQASPTSATVRMVTAHNAASERQADAVCPIAAVVSSPRPLLPQAPWTGSIAAAIGMEADAADLGMGATTAMKSGELANLGVCGVGRNSQASTRQESAAINASWSHSPQQLGSARRPPLPPSARSLPIGLVGAASLPDPLEMAGRSWQHDATAWARAGASCSLWELRLEAGADAGVEHGLGVMWLSDRMLVAVVPAAAAPPMELLLAWEPLPLGEPMVVSAASLCSLLPAHEGKLRSDMDDLTGGWRTLASGGCA